MKRLCYMFLFLWSVFGICLVLSAHRDTTAVQAGKTTITENNGEEDTGSGTTITEDTETDGEEESSPPGQEDAGTGNSGSDDNDSTEGETDKKTEDKDSGKEDKEEDEKDEEDGDGKSGGDSGAGLSQEEQAALQQQIYMRSQRKRDLEDRKQKLKEKIKGLKKKKKHISKYIEALDKEMERVQGQIDVLEEDISVSYMRLQRLEAELKLASEAEQNQYEIMKKRIQYMYETGNTSYIQVILQSDSLTNVFNRMEYMKQVSAYDNHMLENYIKAKDNVSASRSCVEGEMETQTQLVSELEVEKSSIKLLWKNKSRQVEKYRKMLKKSRNTMESTSDELLQQEEAVEKLLAKQRAHTGGGVSKGGGHIGKLGLRWPLLVPGRISSNFGYRTSPTAGASTYHRGVDIAVPSGTYILAAKDGKVTTSSYQSSAGNYIGISHGKGLFTYYMHCSKLLVSAGEKVKQGDVIAYSGSTGVSTGPHLHFGVFVNGNYVNPLDYVSY